MNPLHLRMHDFWKVWLKLSWPAGSGKEFRLMRGSENLICALWLRRAKTEMAIFTIQYKFIFDMLMSNFYVLFFMSSHFIFYHVWFATASWPVIYIWYTSHIVKPVKASLCKDPTQIWLILISFKPRLC